MTEKKSSIQLVQVGERARPHVEGVNNVFSSQFEILGLPWTWITAVDFPFFKTSPQLCSAPLL